MSKREVAGSFAGTLDAILRDCEQNYPQDHLEWVRDSKRIHQAACDRGTGFFTLDLPRLSDLLYEGLADGRLPTGSRIPYGKPRSGSDQRPRLFWALWSRVFTKQGLLQENPDPTSIFLLNTLCSVWKKVEIPCSPKAMLSTYEEYFRIEDELPPSSPVWDGEEDFTRADLGALTDADHGDLVSDSDPKLLHLLEDCQRVSDILVTELGILNHEEVVGRHGPGAVSDLRRNDDKYIFPSWPERLERYFPYDLHGTLNALQETNMEKPLSRLDGLDEPTSYLTDVPKSQKGPRLIAEEPTCFQWIQQGLSDIIRANSAKSCFGRMIDFFDQEPSREFCRRASLQGEYATIDLSSASDRLSTWLVQRVFRANKSVLTGLIHSRTRYLRQDRYKHLPTVIRLRKFASMGSALTFPIQSLVFAALSLGVGKSLHPRRTLTSLAREVRVFGDDIIVPTTWVVPLVQVLSTLGLKVNVGKSFSRGLIRESCGLHAWKGYDVTPFRLRHPFSRANGASHLSWIQSASNAHRMGLWRTSEYLEKVSVPSHRKMIRTPIGAPQVGLLTFCQGLDPATKVVWDPDTQQWFVSGYGFKLKSLRKETNDGINSLLRLSRADYRVRSSIDDFMNIPSKEGFVHELLEAVDGPAILRRVRVPSYLFKRREGNESVL